MLRCREVVPRIASGVVRTLRATRAIAIDDAARDATELLVASALVEALTKTQGKAEAKALAESVASGVRRGLKQGTLYAKDAELRAAVEPVIRHFERVDAAQDTEIRRALDPLEEGTAAWEEDYARRVDARPKSR